MRSADESRSEESQASQLMKAILPQRTSSSKRSRRTDLVTAVINNGMPAPQALTSPTRTSTPSQQQVLGHAGTQPESESQGNEQLDSTGSQKENSPGSMDSDKSGPPSNAAPPKRTKNTSKAKVADQSPADHMSTEAVVPRASMNPPIAAIVRTKEMNLCDPPVPSSEMIPYYGGSVSRPAIVPARSTARAPRKRSPSPASQDSFAGPLPAEDQEKLYLQHTKAFNVPLSELGQLSHSMHSRSVAEQSATTRTQEVNAATKQRVTLSSPPSSPSRVARILVAATPENSSDDSQEIYVQSGRSFPSHSQAVNSYRRGDGSQLSDEFTAGQGQEVGGSYGHHDDGRPLGSIHAVPAATSSSFPDDGSTELTSSYETPTHKAIVDMGLFELSPEFMEPTQPYEPEPTQLDEPVGIVGQAAPTVVQPVLANAGGQQFPAAVPSEGTTTERTVVSKLWNMLSEKKKNEYLSKGIRPHAAPSVQPMVQGTKAADTAELQQQQAQLSNAAAVNGSAPTAAAGLAALRSPTHVNRLQVNDEIDTVPDSEPSRLKQNGSSSATTGLVPAMIAAKSTDADEVTRTLDKMHGRSDRETVPPSVETGRCQQSDSDEEEELPLAVVMRNREVHSVPLARTSRTVTRTRSTSDTPKAKRRQVVPPAPGEALAVVREASIPVIRDDELSRHGSREPKTVKPSRNLRGNAVLRTPQQSVFEERIMNDRTPIGKRKAKSDVSFTHLPVFAAKTTDSAVDESSEAETTTSKGPPTTIMDDQESRTDLADDDRMDVASGSSMVGTVTRNLKRKRAASTATRKSSSRGLAKAIRSSTTPVLHASKKIRAMPSTRRKTDETPTRLFALWKADGLYYPGTVVSHDKDKPARYVVRFDDGDQAKVEISHMRLCDLRVGDQVLLAPYNVNGTVVDVRRAEAESMITVDVGDAAGACRIETNIKNLRIASRTIFRAWNERILTASNVKVGPSTKMPKNASPGSGESYEEPSQPLAKIGLVMTTSPGNKGSKIGGGTAGQKGNEIWSKAKVVKTIRNLGGTVIENWPDLFSMKSEHGVDNKRWVIKRSDVRCLQHNQLDHVFLLSDDASATPKFLIALALGIPCLHFDWLKYVKDRFTLHGGDLGWSRFLLPAGICSYPAGEGKMYHALVSQTVDLCWGDSPDYMEHIMYNPVASKLLEDKSVLCIGDHFVPLPVEKEDDDNEFHRMVPRIILSMGASRVESVHDVGSASQRLTEFHYVVVNDHRDVQGLPKEIKCVDWGWMKNCLIAGRLLPYPDYWKEN